MHYCIRHFLHYGNKGLYMYVNPVHSTLDRLIFMVWEVETVRTLKGDLNTQQGGYVRITSLIIIICTISISFE